MRPVVEQDAHLRSILWIRICFGRALIFAAQSWTAALKSVVVRNLFGRLLLIASTPDEIQKFLRERDHFFSVDDTQQQFVNLGFELP